MITVNLLDIGTTHMNGDDLLADVTLYLNQPDLSGCDRAARPHLITVLNCN